LGATVRILLAVDFLILVGIYNCSCCCLEAHVTGKSQDKKEVKWIAFIGCTTLATRLGRSSALQNFFINGGNIPLTGVVGRSQQAVNRECW
jgi:hypothetical protein